ncbi:hypothetical protein [Halosimplex marinum]|uniref:hypothetical protein n=1 Tax=Halosimplex marinum TaxID=3396620 RepID=UPI003F54D7C0
MRRSDDDTAEERIDDRDDETTVIPSVTGSVTAWAPSLRSEPATDDPAMAEDRREDAATVDDEGGWWDEGLITLLVVVGAVLFVVPEPATTGLGVLLLGAAVVAWLVDLTVPWT